MQERDFDDPSLWSVSEFERLRRDMGSSGYMKLDGPTVLPTTLVADLRRRDNDAARGDVLEVLAACLRHRESALLYLQHEGRVFPLTVFAHVDLVHSPQPLVPSRDRGLSDVTLLAVEPPGLRPPGHAMHERVGRAEHYRPLSPLVWQLALHGPRDRLLADIGGTAAYRALGASARLVAPGALGPAIERLRRDAASLRDIAGWPGMSAERAARLLNALYLAHALMVMRSHPAARPEAPARSGLRLR